MRAWPPSPDHRLLLLVAVVAAGCGGATATATLAVQDLPRTRAVLADGTELCLLVAASAAQRAQGLQGVTAEDLGTADGMVFRYAEPTTSRYHMRNVLMPLDIAFVDDGGTVVDAQSMVPCPAQQTCPTYESPSPFVAAIETPAGTVSVRAGDVLDLGGDC